MMPGRATSMISAMPASQGQVSARKRSGGTDVISVTTRPMNQGTAVSRMRDEELDHEQRDEQPLGLAREVPIEREQPFRRHRIGRRIGRFQRLFELVEHQLSGSLMPQPRTRGKTEMRRNWRYERVQRRFSV